MGHHPQQIMTKTEFIDRLKENKWFEQPQDLIDYRLSVVEFYLKTYTSTTLLVNNGHMVQSNKINLKYNKNTDFCLLNQAYEAILEQFKKGEIK